MKGIKRNYEEDAKRIVSLIGIGKQNAVSRTDLLLLFGGNDRDMRRAIAYARLTGTTINNDQDGCGYYIPDKLEELEQQYRQTEARGKAVLAQLKALREEINRVRNRDQLKLSDVETGLMGGLEI